MHYDYPTLKTVVEAIAQVQTELVKIRELLQGEHDARMVNSNRKQHPGQMPLRIPNE